MMTLGQYFSIPKLSLYYSYLVFFLSCYFFRQRQDIGTHTRTDMSVTYTDTHKRPHRHFSELRGLT